MAVLKTDIINQDNIKVRWEEPYVSAAVNRVMSSLPRGVFRGFIVEQQATPAKGITIKVLSGRDSFLLHEDVVNGNKTAVRYDADFDYSIPYTTLGSEQTFYVWVDVDYSVSGDTNGYLKVGESGDRSDNSLTICKIVIPASQATILDAYITQDKEDPDTYVCPQPDDSEYNLWGLIDEDHFLRFPTQDEKDALDGATSPSSSNPYVTESDTVDKKFAKPSVITKTGLAGTETKFQITGTVYVGTGAQGTAQKWFGLHESASSVAEPSEIGYVAADERLYISAIYKNDDSAEITPSSDADANGFYSNPYIYLNRAVVKTEIGVFCGVEADYSTLVVASLVQEAFGLTSRVDSANVFEIEASRDRKPVTYTISSSTADGNVDFIGASALTDCLDYIQSNDTSAIVFMKKGSAFTYDANANGNKTYSKNITLIGEGLGGAYATPTVTFEVTPGSSGFAITFSDAIEIKNLSISIDTTHGVDAFSLSGGVANLYGCQFTGGLGTVDIKASMNRAIDCRFFTYVETDGYGIFENCYFYNSYTGYTITLVSSLGTVFRNCYFNGSGTYAGISASAASFILESCTLSCSGTNSRVLYSDNSKSVRISNCDMIIKSQYDSSPTQEGAIWINQNTAESILIIDGLDIEITHASDIVSSMFQINQTALRCQADVRNVTINGNDNRLEHYADYNYGMVRFYQSSVSKNSSIKVNGLNINKIAPGETQAIQSNLIGVHNDEESSYVIIDSLIISDLSTLAEAGNTYIVGVNVDSIGFVVIKNSVFDATDLAATPGSYTVVHYGLLCNNTNPSESPGGLHIVDCYFKEWTRGHIYAAESTPFTLRIHIRGYRGYDTDAEDGVAYSRINIECYYLILTNSTYETPANNSAVWVYLNANCEEITIGNNAVICTAVETSLIAIYGADGIASGTGIIIGNVGAGSLISVQNVSNFKGIGDGDTNLNTMAVTLR